jgi:hypothetical protein
MPPYRIMSPSYPEASVSSPSQVPPEPYARRRAYGSRLAASHGGAASLWLAQLSPDGGFAADLLAPSLVIGVGEGLVWVASMVGATSGVAPSESGLASGIVNTAQPLCGALGIAALVAVATGRTGDAATAAALTDGFSAGLTAGAAVAAAGSVLALVPREPVGRRSARATPAPAAPPTA